MKKWKCILEIAGVIFTYDLLFFPLLYYVLLPKNDQFLINLIISLSRVLICCGVGAWFSYKDRNKPVNTKKVVLILLISVLIAIYYCFSSSNLYAELMDLIWLGVAREEFYSLSYPVRIFVCENLFSQDTVFSYMCLVVVYQISQLLYAHKKLHIAPSSGH